MKQAVSLATLILIGVAAGADTLKPAAVFVHPDAPGKFEIIGDVAVVLDGVDRAAACLLEDALAIALLAESVRVVYPSEKELGQRRPVVAEPMRFAQQRKANCLVTGTVVARCGHCARGKGGCANEGIRAVSLSLVDLPQDKVLIWALYEPEKEAKPSAVARAFVELLKESLKEKEER